MRGIARGEWMLFVVLVIASEFGVSQADEHSTTLVVSGHTGEVPVTHLKGQSYVPLDALARLVNGSLKYQGKQITLTLQGGASAAGTVPSDSQPANPAFSRDFLKAGIETMSEIREWRSALVSAIENGYPVTESWVSPYRAQAAKNLRLTSVAATTDSDHNALKLLSKEFDHMQELSNKFLTARKNLSYTARDALKSDPLDQKVLACARSLAGMAANGEFQDDGSCH
jgi:hypothetical protein